jgi:hypothetical protein
MNRRLPPHVAAYPGSVLIHGGIGRVPHWPEIFQETIPMTTSPSAACSGSLPDLRVQFIPGVIGFTNW